MENLAYGKDFHGTMYKGNEAATHVQIPRENDLNNTTNKYTTLGVDESEIPTGYGRKWIPGPTGFEPKDNLTPPRFEFKEFHEHVLTMDYNEPETTIGVASKFTRTYGHRFWAEFFAFLMPIVDFAFALILELISFLFRAFTQLILGTIVRMSDLLVKPFLVFYFNSCTIPCLTSSHNVCKAFTHAISPMVGLFERVVIILTIPVRACRLVEINKVVNHSKPFQI